MKLNPLAILAVTAMISSGIGFGLGIFAGVSLLPSLSPPVNSDTLFEERQSSRPVPSRKVLIAHAGGGIGEHVYTNSLEAMDRSAELGFKFIELDFMQLKNGDVILLHDWGGTYKNNFAQGQEIKYDGLVKSVDWPKSGAEFSREKMLNGLTPMDLDALIDWMKNHPDVFIITDVKSERIPGLRKIRDFAGDLAPRFIAQIFAPDQYEPARALGFENIILTVFMLGEPLRISVEDLGDFCRKNDLFALTMPDSWFAEDTFERLGTIHTPLFLHTTNGEKRAEHFFSAGVQGLYTDYLTPNWLAKIYPSK